MRGDHEYDSRSGGCFPNGKLIHFIGIYSIYIAHWHAMRLQ